MWLSSTYMDIGSLVRLCSIRSTYCFRFCDLLEAYVEIDPCVTLSISLVCLLCIFFNHLVCISISVSSTYCRLYLCPCIRIWNSHCIKHVHSFFGGTNSINACLLQYTVWLQCSLWICLFPSCPDSCLEASWIPTTFHHKPCHQRSNHCYDS